MGSERLVVAEDINLTPSNSVDLKDSSALGLRF